MQFLYPALTAGFFLALLPLVIHLINLLRHRRVKWAAMEFLLQSYKRHRRWVWFRQLLLLVARVAAVLLIVAMLAQLVSQRRYEGLFGNTLTHHYVLLDDSMSMSDRLGGLDAFEQALLFTRELGAAAARQDLRQRITLLRFSTADAARQAQQAGDPQGILADLYGEDVDATFPRRLEELRAAWHPTQLPVGPSAALDVVRRLIGQTPGEQRILYLLSDFRTREWDNPREIRELLRELQNQDVQIRLVSCVRQPHANLAVTDVKPADETRASGVPLFVHVSVTNYGDQVAERVPLKVRTLSFAPLAAEGAAADLPVAQEDETPTLEIERIEPGQTSTQRVQVFFAEPGQHVVEAVLPDDAIAADNRRWCVIDFPEVESVLVIDGDPDQRNAFFIQAIFEPGQRARTGVRPEVHPVALLRDVSAESLEKYSAIYLFDVDRLPERARDNLETYVRGGGGLAVFVGPQVNLAASNELLYRDGAGLFPVPLVRDDLLAETDDAATVPDVDICAADHPVFRELLQGQNPLVSTWRVERFLRVDPAWSASGSTVRLLARLRNGAPLVVEQAFGQGRVLAFLTSYAPYWNDMVLGPTVLVALRLQAYLGVARRAADTRLVGTEIQLPLSAEQYREDLRAFLPTEDPAAPLVIDRSARKPDEAARQFVAAILPRETQRSGIYEMWLRRVDGALQAARFAVNVDPREGDVAQVPVSQLVADLDPVPVEIGYADQYESALVTPTGFNQSMLLLSLLVLLLLVEQALAYLNSYHVLRGTQMDHVGRAAHRASVQRLRAENEADAAAVRDATAWDQDGDRRPRAAGVSPSLTVRGGSR
jgi:uncharacterized membrane protein